MALLRILKHGKDDERLIPIQSGHLDVLFREARIETGLMAVRFHDARREAATVMSKRLANVLELAAVTGHRTLSMLQRYYQPDPEDLADKLG
jgi:integrase